MTMDIYVADKIKKTPIFPKKQTFLKISRNRDNLSNRSRKLTSSQTRATTIIFPTLGQNKFIKIAINHVQKKKKIDNPVHEKW